MKNNFLVFFFLFSSSLCLSIVPDYFGVPIEQAMGLSDSQIKQALSRGDWKILKHLYEKHAVNAQWSDEPRIPKIIHHIWLGSPLPEKYKIMRETWKNHHPDWELILWTDEDIEKLGLTNQDLYDESSNYGVKSDIVRIEILYRFGGLYVDTDFECVKPFDVFHHCCDFYAGAASAVSVNIYNGLIGSKPGHPILKYCIESFSPRPGESESCDDIQQRTGPAFFTKSFFASWAKHDGPSVMFPANYFYPMPYYVLDKKTREAVAKWFKPETFAVHYWNCSWAS